MIQIERQVYILSQKKEMCNSLYMQSFSLCNKFLSIPFLSVNLRISSQSLGEKCQERHASRATESNELPIKLFNGGEIQDFELQE